MINLRKMLKLVGKLLIIVCLFIIIAGALIFAYMQFKLPNASALREAHLQVPLRIFTQDKQLIAEFGDKRRIPVTYDEIPPQLLQALLATEDKNFFKNLGIDILGLARATIILATTGHKSQGGSTITMQVARNFFLSSKKTYLRKFNEILLAIKIDHALTKQEILQLYCNKIFLGKRAYGFAAAAQVYYGKALDQLTLAQYAMLAGLPKAPSSANPINNPAKALGRRTHVLSRMLELGYITPEQYAAANREPVTARYHPQKISVQAPYVAELIREKLYKKYGESIYNLGLDVYTSIDSKTQAAANQAVIEALLAYTRRHGYVGPKENIGRFLTEYGENNKAIWQDHLNQITPVYHLIPAAVIAVEDQQKQAEILLANGKTVPLLWSNMAWAQPILKNGKLGKIPERPSEVLKTGDVIWIYDDQKKHQWLLSEIPKVEGALLATDPNNGAILAMVGGIDFRKSHFNRTLQAKRQAGSSLKPFMYAAALNHGMTLASVINDSPIVIRDSGEKTLWRPQNDTLKFYGPTRLREGLAQSMNLLSIRLLQQTGIDNTINYLQKFGFNPSNLPRSLSLAIGTADVTPLQLATGFSVFANGGYLMTPYIINRIYTQNRKILYQHKPETICDTQQSGLDDLIETYRCAPRAITPQIAYLMNSAMQDVIQHGTAKRARILNRKDIAGKTGTSDNQNDAWFAGYNQNIVAVTWVGFDTPESTHEYGAQAALPMWIDFMKPVLANTAETHLPQPDGLITVRIDPKTGLRVKTGVKPFMFEKFRKNHIPEFAPNRSTQESSEAITTEITSIYPDEASPQADTDLYFSLTEKNTNNTQMAKQQPSNTNNNLVDLSDLY